MLRLFILLLSLFFSATAALAGFCPYSANYRRLDKDADLFFPGNLNFTLDRHYNSNNHRKGLFGPGWATDFDRHIEKGGDGALLLYVADQAEALRFYPPEYTRSVLLGVVAKLIALADKEGLVPASITRDAYRHQLLEKPELLDTLYRQLQQRTLVSLNIPSSDLPWRCREKPGVLLSQSSSGYLIKSEKMHEYYGADGKLTQLLTPAGAGLVLRYDGEGKLQRINIAQERTIEISYQDNGLVSRIVSLGVDIQFSYNEKGLLSAAKWAEGLEYRYGYSHQLLTEVRRGDTEIEQIAYQSDGRLAQITRQQTQLRFGYVDSVEEGKQNFSRTDVFRSEIVDSKKVQESVTHYNYRKEFPPFGRAWLAETRVNSLISDQLTLFSGPGRPSKKEGRGRITRMSYDSLDRLVLEEAGSHSVEVRYAGQTRNVEQVTKKNSITDEATWVHFSYDEYNNLIQAVDSTGQRVDLTYDDLGRIMTMTDADVNCLVFEYNELSKPISIVAPGQGSITVSYDNSGEISDVKSAEGHKMALYVTRLFQRLLHLTAQSAVGGRSSAVTSPL